LSRPSAHFSGSFVLGGQLRVRGLAEPKEESYNKTPSHKEEKQKLRRQDSIYCRCSSSCSSLSRATKRVVRRRRRRPAPEPSRWRGHDAKLGAERGVKLIRGEARAHKKNEVSSIYESWRGSRAISLKGEHFDAGPLSDGELRRRGPCDRAASTARGARAPRPPAAAVAWPARTICAILARMARLGSWLYSRSGDRRARSARPRRARRQVSHRRPHCVPSWNE